MQALSNIIKTIRFGGGPYHCNVCGRNVRVFFRFSDSISAQAKQHGFPHDFRAMETLNVDQCNCPFCLSTDRERLYLLYLRKYFEQYPGSYHMLDFAPSAMFSATFRKLSFVDYVSADIDRPDVDIRVDICDMPTVQSNQFDVVICSHVLEHVASPERALREIHRVMKPAAQAIIMVPLFEGVEVTTEDVNESSEATRWRRFGQGDHVRLFAKHDFVQLLKSIFEVQLVTYNDIEPELARRHAIAPNSVLYVCHKK